MTSAINSIEQIIQSAYVHCVSKKRHWCSAL